MRKRRVTLAALAMLMTVGITGCRQASTLRFGMVGPSRATLVVLGERPDVSLRNHDPARIEVEVEPTRGIRRRVTLAAGGSWKSRVHGPVTLLVTSPGPDSEVDVPSRRAQGLELQSVPTPPEPDE